MNRLRFNSQVLLRLGCWKWRLFVTKRTLSQTAYMKMTSTFCAWPRREFMSFLIPRSIQTMASRIFRIPWIGFTCVKSDMWHWQLTGGVTYFYLVITPVTKRYYQMYRLSRCLPTTKLWCASSLQISQDQCKRRLSTELRCVRDLNNLPVTLRVFVSSITLN